jgi:hypothetical protein
MGEAPHHPPHASMTATAAHETSDVRIRPLAIFLVCLAGMFVVAMLVCVWLFSVFEHMAERHDPLPPPLAEKEQHTPRPLLQVSPREDLDVLRQREHELLTTAAWVDKDRKIARIPIDRAMRVVVEQGLPKWPPVPENTAKPAANDRAPIQPVASSPQGSGITTPPQEGAKP